jgi:hypothetical protein
VDRTVETLVRISKAARPGERGPGFEGRRLRTLITHAGHAHRELHAALARRSGDPRSTRSRSRRPTSAAWVRAVRADALATMTCCPVAAAASAAAQLAAQHCWPRGPLAADGTRYASPPSRDPPPR